MPPKKSLNDQIKKYKLDKSFKPDPLKRKILQSEGRFHNVEDFYKKHEENIEELDKESLLQTMQKEKELKDKEEEIIQLQTEINEQRELQDKQLFQFEYEKEKEEKQLQQDKKIEKLRLQKEIEDIQKQLNYMKEYKDRKIVYEEKIKDLERLLKKGSEEFAMDQKKQHQVFQNKREEKEKETANKIEKRKLQAKLDAQAKIKHSEQTIKENEKLQEELQLHIDELSELQKEREQIIQQNESYRQDLSQNSIGINEYQNINHKQAVKIKKLNEKIEYLNNFIVQEISQYPVKLEKARQQQIQDIENEEHEFKGLTDQLRKKIKEIKQIKGLSQMVLDQRTDIENFFLEALDLVREQHSQSRKKQQKMEDDYNNSMGGHGSVRLPDISSKSSILQQQQINSQINTTVPVQSQSHPNIKQNPKIQISELDPEDKDKILRIVFQKMNTGQPSKNWRSYGISNQQNVSQQYYN